MDAVGLASSIISFIGVAHKLIGGSYEIYKSSTGWTEEHDHTSRVVHDLQQIAARLKAGQQQNSSDQELVHLAGACYDLSVVLTQLLQQFLPKGPGRWSAFVAACRTLRKQKEIVDLEASLDRYRQQISQRLIFLLFEQQSPVKRELDDVRRHGLQLSNVNARKIEHVETQLLRVLNSLQLMDDGRKENESSLVDLKHQFDSLQQLESARAQECDSKLAELVLAIQHLSSLTSRMPMENQVLRRLFFTSIFQRENDVSDPSVNTFRWVFETHLQQAVAEPDKLALDIRASAGTNPIQDSSDKITRRLSMSESLMTFLHQNTGTMLLAGKAGCGKSTFMKYIAHHPTTLTILQEWAGNRKLVLVKVFFWQSDDAFQGSMIGFWRSILFQLLSQCPELVTKVFPQQQTDLDGIPDAMEFREPELEMAFSRLMDYSQGENYCFCCFIDGLDEHQGDNLSHKNMATLLSSWASQASVKMLCSSRPSTVFIDIFRDTGTIVKFHQLNFGDIVSFAEHKFTTSLSTPQMQIARRNCLALVDEIATRAEGVFLWATIAVRALINQSLDHDDSEKALKQRLQECPNGLDAVFQQMLSKVDGASFIQKRSNMALYLAVHNPFESPLNALMYSWLDRLNWFQEANSFQSSSPLELTREVYTEEMIFLEKKKVDNLLHQVTQGLLEVISVPGEMVYLRYRVDLFHRSVREFLRDQWRLGVRKTPFSDTRDEIQAYCRLRSLELEGLVKQKSVLSARLCHQEWDDDLQQKMAMSLMSIYENTFIWLGICSRSNHPPPISCLEDFEAILPRAENAVSPPAFLLLGLMLIDSQASWRWHSRNAPNACSYLHWAAYWSQGHFVKSKHEAESSGVKSFCQPTDLNVLLSSSMAADVDTTKYLLSKSHSPHDRIQISDQHHGSDDGATRYRSMSSFNKEISVALALDLDFWASLGYQKPETFKTSASVWMVFLRDFANNVRSHCWKRRTSGSWPLHLDQAWLQRLAHIIEAYLRAGADPEVFFVLCAGEHSDRLYRVDLYQMLDTFKPDNLSTLGGILMGRPWWNGLWTRRLAKSPPSRMYQGLTTDALLNGDWAVLGVRFENGEALMGSFKVRVF